MVAQLQQAYLPNQYPFHSLLLDQSPSVHVDVDTDTWQLFEII